VIGTLVSADDAKRQLVAGWIKLKWHTEMNRYVHTGIAMGYDVGSGLFTMIEGNTNTDESREGYEVARQKRNLRDLRGDRSRYAFIQTS